MSDGFEAQTRAVLAAAGWTEDRNVVLQPYVAAWQSKGMWFSKEVQEICREFGGLTLHHEPQVRIDGVVHCDSTRIDPVAAVDAVDLRQFSWYVEIAGSPLCPVGMNRSNMILMVDHKTGLFGGIDERLYCYARDFKRSLDVICRGQLPSLLGSHQEPVLGQSGLRRNQVVTCRITARPQDLTLEGVVVDPDVSIGASVDLRHWRERGVIVRDTDLPEVGDLWEAVAGDINPDGSLQLDVHPSLLAKWRRRGP